MKNGFREIPSACFGAKPVVRIRDIDAVVHNYRLFKNKADKTGSHCAAVVKADVHGLMMKDVVPALLREGVRSFFVEELTEGMEFREIAGDREVRVYAMAGLLKGEERYFHENDITPCLNSLTQIERWNRFCLARGRKHGVIHLDTHMNRLGLLDDDVARLSGEYGQLTEGFDVDCYMSHFFDIKGEDHGNCYMQLEVLKKYLKQLPPAPVSFACTDSLILLENKDFNFHMVRPGIGLVGGAPSANRPVSADARHTLEIYAKISQVKTVKKGRTVGYGGAFTAARDTRIALVHIGYKDGYLRLLSGLSGDASEFTAMYLKGYRLPVIGKISLGATTVDVTDVPGEILADSEYVEVVGPNVDIKKLADKVGCYEILMALGRPNKKFADYTLDEYNDFRDGLTP